ncbi:POM121-like protein 2 [Pteronotus mesoamericanus]|uniref:POM121-like protein 2 n=1 Tax=Pteronotus mesoamericanus TaxID=1884717 RepID=UPI0023EA7E93|nr:POM121-like protein 2 [Pteronotus parnellii mesoamericanus]
MGSYLGKLGPWPPPAEGRADLPQRPVTRRSSQALHQVHRVQHVHRAHPAPRLRPARRPRTWDPANPASWAVNEAWKRFPMKRPQNSIVGPLPSDWWESYLKRTIWSLRHPRAVWSPVTVTITPRRGLPAAAPAQAISFAGPSLWEKPPDPRAKETVLRALRERRNGRLRVEEPPSPTPTASPGRSCRKGRSLDARPSAFKPLPRSGDLASFVPSLGPLKRSLDSWSSDHSLRRRPSSSSGSSPASARAGGPLSSKRNAITSSYSSSRDLSEPRKRSVLCASFQMPEWPVKKRAGQQGRSPAPLAPEESPAVPGSTGEQNEAVLPLPSRPGTLLPLSPAPQRARAVPAEGLALKAGLQRSSKTRKDTAAVTTDPPLSVTLDSAGTAPTHGKNPQVASPGPLSSPQLWGDGISVADSALKTPGPRAPPWRSQMEPPPGSSSDAKPTAAVAPRTPASPTSPAADRTRPLNPPAVIPAVPSTRRTLFGTVRRPGRHLSGSAPPAATSADPASKPSLGPRPSRETEDDALPSRISVTAAARSPSDISMPTFKPTFGSTEQLKSMPEAAPFPSKQTSPPAPPASAHLSHSLAQAASEATSSPPGSTSRGSSFKPPLDVGVAEVTSTVGNTHSVPSAAHTFLFRASRAFRTSLSPVTGFVVPSPQHPAIPVGNSGDLLSQSAAQTPPSKSAASLRGQGSPVSASALVTTSQPTPSPGISNLTSLFTVPLGSSSKPPLPPSLGAPPQPALGAAGEQKPGALQPALAPSFSRASVFGNSAVASRSPTPALPAFSSPMQSASGVLAPSGPASHIPASVQPDVGSPAAGLPLGQAGATGVGADTPTRRSGACGSVFGSTAPRPFAFGGSVTPMDCGESGVPNMSSRSGVLSIGAMPSGATHTGAPFGKGWSQNTQGLTSQSTPFALGKAGISGRKTVFGGSPLVPLAQSIPDPRPVKTGSSFVFGIPSPPAKSSVGRGSFKSSAPSFSIGAKPKSPKYREQGHPRRHHALKK